jgi:hypothetical protein
MSSDRIALATAFAAALVLAAPAAQAQPIEPARFAGVYDGQIFSSGSNRPGATALRPATDGTLLGDYSFTEPSGEVMQGELRACRASGRKLACRWSDPYGVGDLEMEFAADFASFRGRWRADNAKGRWNPWTGRRRATS